jgi:hypothetical protein
MIRTAFSGTRHEHDSIHLHRNATRASLALGLLAAVAMGGTALAAGHLQGSTTDTQGLVHFSDFTPSGSVSRLTRFADGVTAVVEAENLVPGHAYTLWWVVFNDPAGCSASPCQDEDIVNLDGSLNYDGIIDAQIAMGHATGNVARGDGTTEFGGTLLQYDNLGHEVVFGAGFTDYLLTASGTEAEIHLVIQWHGKARGGHPLLMQLGSFEAACTPACEDVQAAIHLALD